MNSMKALILFCAMMATPLAQANESKVTWYDKSCTICWSKCLTDSACSNGVPGPNQVPTI